MAEIVRRVVQARQVTKISLWVACQGSSLTTAPLSV
jgi:hypothetical protein